MSKQFLAIDLGATSGRSILGSLEDGKIRMRELTRFPNLIKKIHNHCYWNIFLLLDHIKEALSACSREGVGIDSVGIDTWGVDFAFIGSDGAVLGLPYAYRDSHTDGAPEEYFRIVPRERVYDLTGIQVMNFNSLYQLYAMRRDGSSQLACASKLLFTPDALSFLLTGRMVTEYTIASTSQILNPRTKQMEASLLEAIGLSPALFPSIVMPGETVGMLTDDICRETGVAPVPVIAVAGHDTASAVAAIPASDEKFAYLSSGTWSLMGIEAKDPIIDERTRAMNFTNEGGVEGTTRLLKNITGMWLLERCREEWTSEASYSYPQLVGMAHSVDPFHCMIDPDDPSFANPASMTGAIAAYCRRTGQPVPSTHAEYVRVIFESLALKYRYVLDMLRSVAPFPIEKLHVIGGGSQNELLNQFTANALGIPVVAGPSEATAIGNIMIQAKASGEIASLADMRAVIGASIDLKTYNPQQAALWQEAYERFLRVCHLETI
ncbi:MAG: rhamnulokinase [Rikenellaceae bacterium]|jgi:rhamnulokinase|nr:rhamnulokinase [Rikenellaceae bacterium]